MFWQIDEDYGLLSGYLGSEPSERRDKNGKRMIVLDVCYNSARLRQANGSRHNTVFHIPVVVFGEYASYARTLVKGDCILAVGAHPLKPPRGYTTNPLMVGKRNFGFIGGTGITRAWTSELDTYQKNEAFRRAGKPKMIEENDDDKFDEINGDEY